MNLAKKGTGRRRQVLQNGPAIREFRKLQGWTGSALAKEVGLSPGGLSNIEAERRSTSPQTLGRIAAALAVSVEAISAGPSSRKTSG